MLFALLSNENLPCLVGKATRARSGPLFIACKVLGIAHLAVVGSRQMDTRSNGALATYSNDLNKDHSRSVALLLYLRLTPYSCISETRPVH